jgi:hypothetical protein
MKKNNVRSALAKLQEFYDLGRQSLQARPAGRAAQGARENEKEARRRGVTLYMLLKARLFANSERGYTPQELRELCDLCKRHQTAFGPSHAIALISIPKRQRAAIQRKAIEQGWSKHRIDAEIAKRFGTRGEGGRRPIITSRPEDLYLWIDGWAETWRRWHEALTGDRGQGTKPQLTSRNLPTGLGPRIKAAHKAVSLLHKAVVEALSDLQPARIERLTFRRETAERTNGGTKLCGRARRAGHCSDRWA